MIEIERSRTKTLNKLFCIILKWKNRQLLQAWRILSHAPPIPVKLDVHKNKYRAAAREVAFKALTKVSIIYICINSMYNTMKTVKKRENKTTSPPHTRGASRQDVE